MAVTLGVALELETQGELRKTQTAIEELKRLFVNMSKQWTKPEDWVIGHIVRAPPISFSTAPHGYTKDVCVIKLDKNKFSQNTQGERADLRAVHNQPIWNMNDNDSSHTVKNTRTANIPTRTLFSVLRWRISFKDCTTMVYSGGDFQR